MSAVPILYAEDEETDVMLLQHVFTKAGIPNPLLNGQGREGGQGLPGGRTRRYADRKAYPLPGLVLLDLNLPYWSGLEVLEWSAQQPALRRLPVVDLHLLQPAR